MPLDKSGGKVAFGHNVSAEVHAGKPLKQALAIAYSTQRAPKMAGGGVADALRSVGLDSLAQALEDSWTDAPEVHGSLKPSLGGGALEALSGMNVPFRMVGNKADELGAPPALSAAAEVLPNLLTYGNTARVAGASGRLVKDIGPKMVDKFMAKSPLASMALEPSYVIKPRGGNWMNFIHEADRGQIDPGTHVSGLDANLESIKGNHIDLRGPNDAQWNAQEGWVNKQLKRYLQTNWGTEQDPLADMLVRGELPRWGVATPLDELAARAEEHPRYQKSDPRDYFTNSTIEKLKTVPQSMRMPDGSRKPISPAVVMQDGSGMSIWKNHLADQLGDYHAASIRPDELKDPEWLGKLPPDSELYDLSTGPGSFHDSMHENLSRLFDYFNTLRPEQLNNLSVPDAFRNSEAWHAAQAKKMTDDPIAAGGAELHKEYPDKFKWLKLTSDDALDAEGKMMGHCVGSYCDQVRRGSSEIYSLRDPQGRSHVTVEVQPAPKPTTKVPTIADYLNRLMTGINPGENPEEFAKWYNRSNKEASMMPMDKAMEKMNELIKERGLEPIDQKGITTYYDPSIRQIKGKQNAAPIKDYLPYVQDFVKSGKWDEVRDLRNADMFHKNNYTHYDISSEYGDDIVAAMDQKGLGALTKDASNRTQLYKDVWDEAKKNLPDDKYFTLGDPKFNDAIQGAISRVVNGYVEVHTGPNAKYSKLKPPKFAAGGLVAKVKEAAAKTEQPTKAQAKSGKYKKGEVKLPGLPTISIENPVGSIREGKTAEGKAWKTEMVHHYGEFDGPTGADGDKVDVFIGPDLKSKVAFVIHQLNEEGDFDEHKVMVAFKDEDAAKKGYLANYQKGWNGMGPIVELAIPELARRLKRGDFKKPLRLAAGGLIQGEYLHPAALEHLALYLSTGS